MSLYMLRNFQLANVSIAVHLIHSRCIDARLHHITQQAADGTIRTTELLSVLDHSIISLTYTTGI